MTNVSLSSHWHFDDWRNCQLLRTNSCAIYAIDLAKPSLKLSFAWQLLSVVEKQRANAFTFTAHRDRYIQIHAILRQILAYHSQLAVEDINLSYNPFGKPEFSDDLACSEIKFNLSHSGNQALVAVSKEQKVGIDIERIDDNLEFMSIAQHSFTETECAQIISLPPQQQRDHFYRFWTCKESFIKAIGKGFNLPLKQFEIALESDSKAELINTHYQENDKENWQLCMLPCHPGYAAALTLSKQLPQLKQSI